MIKLHFRLIAFAACLAGLCGASAFAGIIQGVSADRMAISAGEQVRIEFRLTMPADVTLKIVSSDFDTVRTFELKHLDAGRHEVPWNGTTSTGAMVPPEAYSWRIEAVRVDRKDTWEPASLYSRPIEHIRAYQWDSASNTLTYVTPVPMRVWVRAGFWMGAIMRTLVEGEPREVGRCVERWDGLDESGEVDMKSRQDRVISIFGYRLPSPSVIVRGQGPLPAPARDESFLPLIEPKLAPKDPWWHRRRAFVLADRSVPLLQIEQLDETTFAASLVAESTDGTRALQRILSDRVRLKWFVDGHCAHEDVDAALPSLVSFLPDQIPRDGKPHFVTANLVGAMHQVCVASKWIDPGE